jgi:glutathione S-transferase
MLRLYYFPGTCAFAPHMLLEEIGEPFELEMVVPVAPPTGSPDLASSPEWRAVNPKGRVPALLGVPGSSGGAAELLTEVSAILFYLGRCHPALGLLPEDPAEQARCIEWCNYLATSLHAVALAQISRGARFIDDPAQHPAIARKGLANARDGFAYVETVLADGRPWALPGGLSMVDFYLYLFFTAGERVFPDMAERYPHWATLAAKMAARPAVQRATAREQLALAEARQGRFHGRRLIEPPGPGSP